MEVRGRKVIVTGGARGLGRVVIDQLVAQKADVTVFDMNAEALAELREEQAGVTCLECDVSDYERVVSTTREYHERFGAADVLVNNAGILESAPLVRISATGIEKHAVEIWNRVLASDLSSVFYMTACIVERMVTTRTRGVIVNISSVAASGNPGQSAYSAAKAGVNALTAVWAKELGALGIRVVGVAPGFADTASTKGALSPVTLDEVVKKVPLLRLARPEEVAYGVLFAIKNDFFNGKVLDLDGGLVI